MLVASLATKATLSASFTAAMLKLIILVHLDTYP